MSGVLQTHVGGVFTPPAPLPIGLLFYYNNSTDISSGDIAARYLSLVFGKSSGSIASANTNDTKAYYYGTFSSHNHTQSNSNVFYIPWYSSANNTPDCVSKAALSGNAPATTENKSGDSCVSTVKINIKPKKIYKRSFKIQTNNVFKLPIDSIFYTKTIASFSSGSYTRLNDMNEEYCLEGGVFGLFGTVSGTSFGSPTSYTKSTNNIIHAHGTTNPVRLQYENSFGSSQRELYYPKFAGGRNCTATITNISTPNLDILRHRLAAFKLNVETSPQPGMIFLYDSNSSIPPGWALCDGNNGTPNLVDRLVVVVPPSLDTQVNTQAGTTTATLSFDYSIGSSTISHNHSGGRYDNGLGAPTDEHCGTMGMTTMGNSNASTTHYAESGTFSHGFTNKPIDYNTSVYIMKT